jgi:hypothetical protein
MNQGMASWTIVDRNHAFNPTLMLNPLNVAFCKPLTKDRKHTPCAPVDIHCLQASFTLVGADESRQGFMDRG